MTRYTDLNDLAQQCSADVKALSPQLFADTKAPAKPNKYGNRRVEIDGVWFDSQKEATRWGELQLLERTGAIRCLERQVWFKLTAGIRMRLDATYIENGKQIAEDVKGMAPTRDWLNKAKLFRACYPDWELRIV